MKVCRKCGVMFETRHCLECAKVRADRRRAANPQKVKAENAAWRAANREKCKAYRKKWDAQYPAQRKRYGEKYRAKNAEKIRARVTKWRAEHPEAIRIYSHTRHSKISGGTLSKDLIQKLLRLQKGKCPCCMQQLGNDYELDHIVPLAKGGRNEDVNMQLLRRLCNRQKHAKHPIDFMQSRGFLI